MALAWIGIWWYREVYVRTPRQWYLREVFQGYFTELALIHGMEGDLPYGLPGGALGGFENGPIRPVDPYHRGPKERTIEVRFERTGANREPPEGTYCLRGEPLSYRWISDSVAILYSFGPDCDDDLGRLSRDQLFDVIDSRDSEARSRVTYNHKKPTGDGDIWKVIDFRGDRR